MVGTNASGKSNIRDALRFLHGIGLGYSVADIIGEKYESGILQWSGIRGGTRELTFQGAATFTIEAFFALEIDDVEREVIYKIEINPGGQNNTSNTVKSPFVVAESLFLPKLNKTIFKIDNHLSVEFYDEDQASFLDFTKPVIANRIYAQSLQNLKLKSYLLSQSLETVVKHLKALNFLDLEPERIRQPSFPGQNVLGDRGENLSSVLFEICQDPQRKEALLEWVQELTPMDAKDFEFPSDFTGKVLLTLVEGSGQRISAYSASDGTLRFLAMLAALLGSEPAQFYFFEELDNGIHPTRLHLLLELIEQKVSEGKIQMVATTHSPQLLRLLSSKSLESASLTYRLPEHPDAKIQRILDIPDAKRLIEKGDLADLHESGWLENAMYFLDDEDASE
ncbi:MAG: ATP-binding protein [Stenomitos rutilans HA7619-LM2]|nr:ATP-binding protein [Stenomitos rutilans HA7619-LM2]